MVEIDNTTYSNRINMRNECILIYEDKFVFSYLRKDGKMDFDTIHKMYWIASLGGLVGLFIVSYVSWEKAANRDSMFYPLFFISVSIFVAGLYHLLYISDVTEIQKKHIKKIYIDERSLGIAIIFKKEGKRQRKRIIALPMGRERETALQLIHDNKIL